MPSPPAAPGTVTEPIWAEGAVGIHGELVNDPVPAGLHVQVLTAGRGRGVHRAGVGGGLPERSPADRGQRGVAAHRGAAGVGGVKKPRAGATQQVAACAGEHGVESGSPSRSG